MKINNCLNCGYKDHMNGKIVCGRPLEIEHRIANTGDILKKCPCHSIMDEAKMNGKYIDDGCFHVSEKLLLELEKIIFGE